MPNEYYTQPEKEMEKHLGYSSSIWDLVSAWV